MALTGLSRGDRQAFSLECLCFSAIWGDPGNGRKTRNVRLLPTRSQKNNRNLLLPSTLKRRLASGGGGRGYQLAQPTIPSGLHGRTEGSFMRAPPAGSSLHERPHIPSSARLGPAEPHQSRQPRWSRPALPRSSEALARFSARVDLNEEKAGSRVSPLALEGAELVTLGEAEWLELRLEVDGLGCGEDE